MKKLLVVGIIILLVGMGIPSTGINVEKSTASYDGNTLYVGGSGPGNYSKIQDAIDNASDGDTVFVYEGLYTENINIEKSINLIGEDKESTIIDGDEKGDVVFIYSVNVNFSCFTIRNSCKGIYLHADYVTISSNNIFDCEDGINSVCTNYNNFVGNYISDCLTGIEMITSGILGHGTNIENNRITNTCYGIVMLSSMSDTITNNIISNNTQEGISIFGSNNNTINSNVISNNNNGGVSCVDSHNNNFMNNTFSTNQEAGIYLIWSDNNFILYNNISDNEDGIELKDSSDNLISKNTIYFNTDYGIELHATSKYECINNRIKQNIISSNSQGLYLNNSNNCSILQNNFLGNQHSVMFENCSNTWNQNYWKRARFLPKIIIGKIGFKYRPWFNIDWHPAKEPYDI
jgi:parallel beta-helix repeat protein